MAGYARTIKKQQKAAVTSSRQIGDELRGMALPGYQTENPWYAQATGGMAGLLGGMGQSPMDQAYQNYAMGQIQGVGLNPYEAGSPYQQYQAAAMQQFKPVMSQLASQFGAKGMLRGSASANASQRAMETMGTNLQAQGYDAYNQALQRQYGMAQFAPQMGLSQMQAGLQGYQGLNQMGQDRLSYLNQVMQQGYQDKLARAQGALGAYGQVQQGANKPKSGFGEFMSGLSQWLG